MAARKQSEPVIKNLFILFGTLVLLPVLCLSLVFSIYFYLRYASGTGRRRIMDIRRMGAPLIKGALLLGVVVGTPLLIAHAGDGGASSGPLGGLVVLVWLLTGVAVALHLAVMYLGVVGDPENDRLIFPPDMQSYGVFDYLMLRFVLDYCRTDSVPLSALTRVTRGYGTELYIHGDFGSRALQMSSKQKRDECMVMIQDMVNTRGIVFGEMESY